MAGYRKSIDFYFSNRVDAYNQELEQWKIKERENMNKILKELKDEILKKDEEIRILKQNNQNLIEELEKSKESNKETLKNDQKIENVEDSRKIENNVKDSRKIEKNVEDSRKIEKNDCKPEMDNNKPEEKDNTDE